MQFALPQAQTRNKCRDVPSRIVFHFREDNALFSPVGVKGVLSLLNILSHFPHGAQTQIDVAADQKLCRAKGTLTKI